MNATTLLTTVLVAGTALLTSSLHAQDSRPRGALKVERSQRGDTTVVRTLSGSVWGDRVQLVEELRIGTKDGDGPDSFGAIAGFALFPNGVIAIFDQSVPALRLFTPEGKLLRTLGRDGAGPGEYRNQTLGLAVDRNGVLLMYDPRNARLNRWTQDGTLLPSWRVPAGLYGQYNLQLDSAGNTYIAVTTEPPQPGKEWAFGLARLNQNGELVDTIRQPPFAAPGFDPSGTFFAPQKYWFLTRAGGEVRGFGGAYSITVSPRGRGAVRMERVTSQVTLAPGERSNYQEVAEARRRDPMIRTSGLGATVPAVKPYFSELRADLDGRIWARVYAKAEPFDPPAAPARQSGPPVPPIRWRQSMVLWDVFERDGSYLGQLSFPRRTELMEAKGDRLWVIQRGEDDEQYIVRYRVVAE